MSKQLDDHINPQEECSKVFPYLFIFQYIFPLKDQQDPVITEEDINSIIRFIYIYIIDIVNHKLEIDNITMKFIIRLFKSRSIRVKEDLSLYGEGMYLFYYAFLILIAIGVDVITMI